jgi:hypothetical protein
MWVSIRLPNEDPFEKRQTLLTKRGCMTQYGLAVTVHDPDERWLRRFSPALPKIVERYRLCSAACTEATSRFTIGGLKDLGFRTVITAPGAAGLSRIAAIRLLLEDQTVEWVQNADLDRLLHWENTYPDELTATLRQAPTSDYVALGRSPRALASHPHVQILAEVLTNRAFARALRIDEPVDLVAGSSLFSRRAAEILVEQSTEPSGATDLEWPALILHHLGVLPEFRAVEGLEFETADYYLDQIERAGSMAIWLQEAYDTPEVWHSRAKLAADSIAALKRVLGDTRMGRYSKAW